MSRSRSPRTRDLGLSHALHLSLELVRGAAEVGDVAQDRQHGVFRADAFAERMREHLEQQIVAFVGVDEIELARTRWLSAGHRRLGQERREEQVVQLDRAASSGRIVFACRGADVRRVGSAR